MARNLFDDDHDAFRAAVATFLEREMLPHRRAWDEAGIIDRDVFEAAGRAGVIATAVPVEHGGGGAPDFRFNVILNEEIHRLGLNGAGLALTLHNDIVLPYVLAYADADQGSRWLPGMARGSLIGAVAMTEPGAGSDLGAISTTAIRDGDHYVLNGSKTFISNGILADLVVVAATTDPEAGSRGLSLLVLERDTPGFTRGRRLDKVGLHAQDTAELHFADVRVPVANLLGEPGQGFAQLSACLVQERLSIAVSAVAGIAAALEWTSRHVGERHTFGRPLGSYQHVRFTIAEIATELAIARTFVDRCIAEHVEGLLTPASAAQAKWWTTELYKRVVDSCVQLHGGYGYMLEHPIGRAYQDARITTIYGGATEVMKEIVAGSVLAGIPRS